ncbi:Deoxyuridine 5'-triphosphate nucleotidohydrolase [Arachis hypogaea]|nr:Deoxyuridine 5'-triphosphate nucleotidohydrolase [Arachis hypogaea]
MELETQQTNLKWSFLDCACIGVGDFKNMDSPTTPFFPLGLLLSPPVTISLAPRSGLVLKHSIDVGAGVIDADRVLCSTSRRSQILDLGSSFLRSAVDTACKAGEVVFITLPPLLSLSLSLSDIV